MLRRNAVTGYLAGIVTGTLAILPLLLAGTGTQPSPFLLMLAAVTFSSWYGGLIPGLLATAIGAVAAAFVYLPPTSALDSAFLQPSLQDGLFVLVALVITYLIADLREAQQRARQVTRRLRKQLDLTSAISRNLGEGVCTTDARGRITSVNPAAVQMLGWSQAELIGKDIREALHAAPQTPAGQEVRELEALTTGSTVRLEFDVYRRRDGSLLPVDAVSSPIRGDEQVDGIVIAFRDVSERIKAERRLSMQYRVSRNLAVARGIDDALPSVVRITAESIGCDWGELRLLDNAVTTPYSTAWQRVEQNSEKDATSSWSGVLSPDLHEVALRVLHSGQASWEGPPQSDMESQTAGGGTLVIPMLGSRGMVGLLAFGGTRLTEPDDVVMRTLMTVSGQAGQFVDKIEAENAQRTGDARFHSVFEDAAVGMLLVDARGRIIESNVALQRILGYTKAELHDLPYVHFIHPSDRNGEMQAFAALSAGKHAAYQQDARYQKHNGRTIWLRMTMSRIHRGHSGPEFAIAILEDIGERPRGEEQPHHQAINIAGTGE